MVIERFLSEEGAFPPEWMGVRFLRRTSREMDAPADGRGQADHTRASQATVCPASRPNPAHENDDSDRRCKPR